MQREAEMATLSYIYTLFTNFLLSLNTIQKLKSKLVLFHEECLVGFELVSLICLLHI